MYIYVCIYICLLEIHAIQKALKGIICEDPLAQIQKPKDPYMLLISQKGPVCYQKRLAIFHKNPIVHPKP